MYGKCGFHCTLHRVIRILTLCSARATSAAPSFFRPANVAQYGAFQDGGLRYNNPVNLAIWESRQIWPTHNSPDFVLSLGTGTTEATSPKASQSRHILQDGFIPRLCRSFMSSLDGQATWRELEHRLGDENRIHYFRLNVTLEDIPAIDDASCMERLRNSVHFQPKVHGMQLDLVSAMLAATFFFELDKLPQFDQGLYRCEGTIYCRNNSSHVLQALEKLAGRQATFSNDKGHLADVGTSSMTCSQCNCFQKRINFHVRTLDEIITIYLKPSNQHQRRISGFPNTPNWFLRQQGLDSISGTRGYTQCFACKLCSTPKPKRDVERLFSIERSSKRARIDSWI
jgi:hypothetical protein